VRPRHFLKIIYQELCERNDIVDVVSGYVRLSKKRRLKSVRTLPVHSEKPPSFSVSPDKQIYHCFGCGKGGGVINFIMEIEQLTFPEAVEVLAKRANMPLPEQENTQESRRRARMLELNKAAARFYYSELRAEDGQPGRNYLSQRQISSQTATKFGLGYAHNSWDRLRNAMKQQGFSDAEMFDAGLVKRGKNGGFYDAFRDRLVFPVVDVRGNVIGFSGRILGDGEPKYLNSPETLVFNKSRNLFGLNLAKKSKAGYIILVEGNVDVVSLHQAGFDSAVASLGTSLTAEQARLLSRFTKEIIIAYDNDGAGQKASQRAISLLEKLDLRVRVLQMTEAKDPDEYIKKKGPDAFQNLIDRSEGQLDYRLGSIANKYDLGKDDQKIAFLKEATEMLATIPNKMESEVYIHRVSDMTGIKAEVLSDEVEQKRKKLRFSRRRQEERNSHPEKEIQPAKREFRYENTVSATAEEGIIRLMYLDQGTVEHYKNQPDASDFSSPELRAIYEKMKGLMDSGKQISIASLSGELEPEKIALLSKILQKPENLTNSEEAWNDYANKIKEQKELSDSSTDLLALAKKLKEKKGYGE